MIWLAAIGSPCRSNPDSKKREQAGTDLKDFSVPEGATAANGNASDTIVLTTPKKDGSQFFKVTRK